MAQRENDVDSGYQQLPRGADLGGRPRSSQPRERIRLVAGLCIFWKPMNKD